MQQANIPLPYFDILLEQLSLGDAAVQQAFGRHVHWGYWPNWNQADGSIGDFASAAEILCQRVYKAAGVREGDILLDTGCGFGGTIASLNEQFQNLEMTGLNIDPRQLARAKEKVKPLANNKIAFVEGDACKMPFPDNSMDVVLAVECIFHFPSRAAFFQEARRVLRPGGRLGVCDFVPASIFRLFQKLLAKMDISMITSTYGRVDSYFTVSDYQKLAKETGFNVTSIEDITSNTLPTYPVVRQIFDHAGNSDAVKATAAVEMLAKLGLLRYVIFSFTV
ncbi:MAG TPA: 16S rRNA (cytosine(1402)-N(4))-methyltransferase [Cyanothece sp. UBA12306]|nr:16S rRNA (cytosine(1402)-N(4))-methyltransferase [Cyanothece sp. UBA12306]